MKIKKLEHLSEIFQEYDAFIIDLWGVMHDGVNLYNSAVKAVMEKELFFYQTRLDQQRK